MIAGLTVATCETNGPRRIRLQLFGPPGTDTAWARWLTDAEALNLCNQLHAARDDGHHHTPDPLEG